MQAGKLNCRVTIQSLQAGQDAIGQPVTTWTDVATVWASVEDLTGREYQAAQATQNPVQTRIRIRYRAGIVASMRALYGNVIYNIEAVLDRDGGRVELQLMCTKGLNNG
jgi:SPP1 family predicted phage head-tail adaptor